MAGACVVRRNSRWVVVVRLIYGNDLDLAVDYSLKCSGVLAAADKGECLPLQRHTTLPHYFILNTKLPPDACLHLFSSLPLRWH